ncbi:hypothetical protein LZQ00_07820 [Sphingobacterium sp. SRCM116780]|uniref:hypothetical protein n=1 Tax=Sphingobacterium sp. SRCM116780 TaxID=2907623 RepID=UPI001F2376F5|nr:hypothetical protein [Sphingobacterium sp. SRCM116780]UIR57718.1 hypothetical protein LZQ00_07820 [Sphingobacterium sp. SRCM116780]
MNVIDHLATTLGRRDELPNQDLAKQIVSEQDAQAIQDLIALLKGKNKNIQQDSIKVLYEIGAVSPDLIAPFHLDFISLLSSTNNRMQWGAMTALDTILLLKHDVIYPVLPQLITVAEQGSVITMDKCISILIKYLSLQKYDQVFHLLNEQLLKCPTNQLPMYAEQAFLFIPKEYQAEFVNSLTSRLDTIEKESKKARVRKVIKKLQQ